MSEAASRVVVSRRYAASPNQVFDAFLDAETASRFLFATKDGAMIVAEVDPRTWATALPSRSGVPRRMGDVRHVGEYLEIDRPKRLVFTFGVPQFDPGMTTVSIEILPSGGGSASHLDQRRRARGTTWSAIIEGWSRILAGLEPAGDGIRAAGGR